MDDSIVVRCNFCSLEIPRTLFEEGRAVRVAGRNYCQTCMSQAIERGRNPDQPPDLRTPRPSAPNRRRHERKDTVLFVEISIYRTDGRLHHRGTALMRNISLSGALLGGIIVPGKNIPTDTERFGLRMLDGPLKDVEIRCRLIRYTFRGEGLDVGLEFEGTESLKVEQLRKIV